MLKLLVLATVLAAAPAAAQAPRSSLREAAGTQVAGAVAITSVSMGSHVDAALRTPVPKTLFKPTDQIHISIGTQTPGPTPVTATLGVMWTYGRGQDQQAVHDESRKIRFEGGGRTEFHISKPDGWPSGDYQVEVFLDGERMRTVAFTVR